MAKFTRSLVLSRNGNLPLMKSEVDVYTPGDEGVTQMLNMNNSYEHLLKSRKCN